MNLSGIIFHIEENAYDKLNKYLSTIKSYFNNSEGKDEIMNDIESRIAEMLQEKVSKTKQAVLMMDVESVIAVMGKPEDFAGDDQSQSSETPYTAETSKQYNGRRRRVFRDPDEKLLGGVCSGIANYFDFDPLWLRAAFAISFFIFGSGFLLYIILWIIIPQAKTTAEKLEMRGEKVDVNNISKAVNDEFEDLKKRVKDFGDNVSNPQTKERVRSGAQRATDFIGDVFSNMIKVVGKIVAVFLVIISVIMLVGLLATIFGKGTISVFNNPGGNIHFSLYEFASAVLPNDLSIELVVIGLILFLGVPLLSVIYSGIRHLFGIKQKNRIVKYTANILWLFGLALMVYIATVIGSDFSEQATNKQRIEIRQPVNGLYLDLAPTSDEDIEIMNKRHRRINFGDWILLSKDDNKFRIGYPELNIVASETDSFELVAIRTANGFDKKDAVNRAKNIDFSIIQNDSTLLFNGYFDIRTEDKLRAQDLQLILKVPMNKTIYLSQRMERIIFDIDNVQDALDSDMVNRRWIMTKRGLQCIDCDGLEESSSPYDSLDRHIERLHHMKDDMIPPPPAPPSPSGKNKKYFFPLAVTLN
jgi:phage shock protein PspC (stress-responsive transcriptional regulator)